MLLRAPHQLLVGCLLLGAGAGQRAAAQNPLILNQFTADPTARVFGSRVYVYPSHDIPCTPGRGRPGWFCMEDYHVFSSANLTDWTDHGVIVTQNKVPWVKPDSYSMWAPECVARNGKYYFYFPSTPSDTTGGKGFRIGVAVADAPTGPFVPQRAPIKGVSGIDPNVLIDKDGQAYLYWSDGNIYAAKLRPDMLELSSAPVVLGALPSQGLKEGPYVFERQGTYYLTYPHVANKTERLEYATSNSPLGPFQVRGVLMDESPTSCWTNHHSITQVNNQWYLFYHHNDLSPAFDKNRSIRVDSLFFNADGTIRKVLPTLRGVGLTAATQRIQLDRYSRRSATGAGIAFLDTLAKGKGWKTVFTSREGWVQYNSVQFGPKAPRTLTLRVAAAAGATLQLRLDKASAPILAQIVVPKGSQWRELRVPVAAIRSGPHALLVSSQTDALSEIDWVQFE
jgi:GH43 family beta-xylosidase